MYNGEFAKKVPRKECPTNLDAMSL